MVNFLCKSRYNYEDLKEIMALLRSPEGCPWDKVQTHGSLRRNLMEETCEVLEALDREDPDALREELGDVLLQVVFHARLEEEQGRFGLDDVVDGICQKLVYRHPHVFGAETVENLPEQLDRWEVLKRAEKGQESAADAVDAVAGTLPALWRAEKMQAKAAKAGFCWSSPAGALAKVREETEELTRALDAGERGPHGVEEELGDLLFAAVRVGQMTGVDPETALHAACGKFAGRFRRTEELAQKPMSEYTEPELTALWERAKEES